MRVLGVAWLLTEPGVAISKKTRHQFIAGGDCVDPAKTQFLDQAILHGLVGALDTTLCLRRVGAKNVDVERLQGTAELRHAVPLDCPGGIDPKGAVLVAVERDRLTMRLEILAGCLEVVEGRLKVDSVSTNFKCIRRLVASST